MNSRLLMLAGPLLAIALQSAGAAPPPPQGPEADLPADYLERTMDRLNRDFPGEVIPYFNYGNPRRVRLAGGEGSPKRPATALGVFFAFKTKDGLVSLETFHRTMIFEKGILIDDSGPADESIDWLAADPPPPADPNLPPDFRAQLLARVRRSQSSHAVPGVAFSDPVHVEVSDPEQHGKTVEMSAVTFSYGPVDRRTGSPFLMIVQGAALFDKGKFVRMIGFDDKTIEWAHGRPNVHSDDPKERSANASMRLADAERLFDPVRGPARRLNIRADLLVEYEPVFARMKLPAETAGRLIDLLEARGEARNKALYDASRRGVEPDSAAMDKAIEEEKAAAERNLRDFLGPGRLNLLEYLAKAPGYYWTVMANGGDVQLDLEDAGIPMTEEQVQAVGEICEDVCDPKRNATYPVLATRPRNPSTRLSATRQAVVDRIADVLSPEQVRIITLNLGDRSTPSPNDPAVRRRQARRIMMREYGEALAELKLPPQTLSRAKDLLIERRDTRGRLSLEALHRGDDPRSPKVAAEINAATDAVGADLEALLGHARFLELEHLHDLLPIRDKVARIEAYRFKAAGCPMTDEQIRLFAEAAFDQRNASPPILDPRVIPPVDPKTGVLQRDVPLLARAEGFLSRRQMDVLRMLRRENATFATEMAANQPPPLKRYPPQA